MKTVIKEIDDTDVESGPADQGDALHQAVDRIRTLVEDSLRYHQHWQASAHKAGILRAELELVKGELEAVRAELAAIQGSRGFRFLQRLYRIRLFLMPHGSHRERFGAVVFRMARGLARGPAEGHPPTSVAVSIPPVVPPPAIGDTPSTGNLLPMDGQPQERTDIDDQAYQPHRWRLIEKSPPAVAALNLIILSANHRAGSTLLQRICNARKGTLIWGEHGGSLSYFREIYATAGYCALSGAQERDDYFRQEGNPNLWIASISPELDYVQQAVVSAAREYLATLYQQYREGHDILGFKEVRYDHGEIQLLRRCYPEAHFLLLVRNPLNTWRSTPRHWWYVSVEEWAARWNQIVGCFRHAASIDPRCHLIRYEDLIRQEPKTMAVLAEAAKVTPEQVSLVLSHKIGSNRVGINETEKNTILTLCREPMEVLGYL
jgi:hypothetical protein